MSEGNGQVPGNVKPVVFTHPQCGADISASVYAIDVPPQLPAILPGPLGTKVHMVVQTQGPWYILPIVCPNCKGPMFFVQQASPVVVAGQLPPAPPST